MKLQRFFVCILLCLCMLFGIFTVQADATESKWPAPTFSMGAAFKAASKKKMERVTYGESSEDSTAAVTISRTDGSATYSIATESNKLSELCFIPIVTTIRVPAYTTYSVTYDYTVSGTRTVSNKNATAASCFQLTYFGETIDTGALTFSPATADTTSASNFTGMNLGIQNLAKGYVNSKGSSGTTTAIALSSGFGTGTYSPAYVNNTDKDKDITLYFGLMAATQYGSTYKNKIDVSCKLVCKSVRSTVRVTVTKDGKPWTGRGDIDIKNANTTYIAAELGDGNYTAGRWKYFEFGKDTCTVKVGSTDSCEVSFIDGISHVRFDYYTLSYAQGEAESGTLPVSSVRLSGKKAYASTNRMNKSGYTHTGWQTGDGTFVGFSEAIILTAPVTLTPVFEANTYSVTLVSNGGTGTNLASYTYGVGAALPTDWTKQCARFEGWYTAQTGGTKVTRISTATLGDQRYYARWSDAHTAVADAAVAPTCTKTGLTAGTHCSVCQTVLAAQTTIPAAGHTEVIDAAVEPTLVKTGLTEGKHCAVCGAILVSQQTLDMRAIRIRYNCAFGSDLSMVYAIPETDLAGCTDIRLTVEQERYAGSTPNGTETQTLLPVAYDIDGAAYYRFDYEGIGAAQMGDGLTATLHFVCDGAAYSRDLGTYDLGRYAKERLRTSASEAYRTLMTDLLKYGAAVQAYLGYRTDVPVDNDLNDAENALANRDYAPLMSLPEDSDAETYPAAITKKAFRLDGRITLYMETNLDRDSDLSGVSLRIRYTDRSGNAVERRVSGTAFVYSEAAGGYTVCFDELKASELRSVLTLTLVRNGADISQSVRYSFDTYVESCLAADADADFKALLECTLRYADSARNYFTQTINEQTEE